MLSPKRALILALSLLLLMSGCASSRAPSVYVAQTQVQIPPPPKGLQEVSEQAPNFVQWMEGIYSSSMSRLGLSQPDSQPKQTLSATR